MPTKWLQERPNGSKKDPERILEGLFTAPGGVGAQMLWGYNPVQDDRSGFTRGCIPRDAEVGDARVGQPSTGVPRS